MASYETKQIFSENLSRLLKEHGKTQAEFAHYMGVSTSTVSSWCTGDKMPRMDKVEIMADYFNVSRSELIYAQTTNTVNSLSKLEQALLDALHKSPEETQMVTNLTEQEKHLLDAFRRMNEQGQATLLTSADALAQVYNADIDSSGEQDADK